ncbi:MAG: NAD-glutamate dehydrogenase [Thiohalospira sp.]
MDADTSTSRTRLEALEHEATLHHEGAGEDFVAFVRTCYRDSAPEDLEERDIADLVAAARHQWQLLHQPRLSGERHLRLHDPAPERDNWSSPHTVIHLVQADSPFLIDSLRMAVNRVGLAVHWVVHPLVRVHRDGAGRVQAIGEGEPEAVLRLEIDRLLDDDDRHAALRAELETTLDAVAAAVTDWAAMRSAVLRAAEATAGAEMPAELREEANAYLRWLDDDHFTFLGFRAYRLEQDADHHLRLVAEGGSGLGLLRGPEADRPSASFDRLTPAQRALATLAEPLMLTKSRHRSPVHRPDYLDHVGVRRFDERGRVIGEWRFVGLYTSNAHHERPHHVPILRRKIAEVMASAGVPERSHTGKAFQNILETLPRDELIQADSASLLATTRAVAQLQERQRVRLLLRPDPFARFMTALIYLPREGFNTRLRLAIQELLREAFAANDVDTRVWLDDSELARVHLLLHTDDGIPDHDPHELERRIAELARDWDDRLRVALVEEHGESHGLPLARRYQGAFPLDYRENQGLEAALSDIQRLERLAAGDPLPVALLLDPARPDALRLRLLRPEAPFPLSDLLPLLENMGVRVAGQRSHRLRGAAGETVWLQDLGLAEGPTGEQPEAVIDAFREAFLGICAGRLEDDELNRLILHAGLDWRGVRLLRACHRYLHLTGLPFTRPYVAGVLAEHEAITRGLVALFHARFDPDAEDAGRADREAKEGRAIEEALEAVAHADADRILRRFLDLIRATMRTSFFRSDSATLALKIEPARLPELPQPRPAHEIFVHAPHMEGIHLRGGDIARGGIRWSDRLEDYRTEVLGLMKTQMVKNAVIVPVGAKGGFVARSPHPDETEPRQRGRLAYCDFIRGLLDLTDNRVGAEVVPPPEVVRHDGDDPYLVVAADKGTAAFSDTANAIAAEYGFWLDDAFASGGSSGYDHKAMGITARGAWESVRRHFRELETNPDEEAFTAVGIGSMNGDVFGNGLLLSRRIRLVAAFSHREVFIDPDPDPETGYRERKRLFHADRGDWADYDPALISEGGGVWPRSAKSIPLHPRIRELLGVNDEALAPDAVVRALLRMPVDLLFNGAVGTFVKAAAESHEAVGDRATDAVRVDAESLRCRVIGEGGNLGLTQAARIAFARRGGRVFADFIDNAGGVSCSDREVNIKILLRDAIDAGALPAADRDPLLAEMTDTVAEQVLDDCREQTLALALGGHTARERFDEHARLARQLERAGYLDRTGWAFPDEAELTDRQRDGESLTAPEQAVLMSAARMELYDALLASELCEDSDLATEVSEYFPAVLNQRFGDLQDGHRLRRAIAGSTITNTLVNRMGASFAFRLAEQTGADYAAIARAFLAARRIFDLPDLWRAVAALDGRVATPLQYELFTHLRRLASRATLWLLRNRSRHLPIAATAGALRPAVETLAGMLESVPDAAAADSITQRAAELDAAGVPEPLASGIARLPFLLPALDMAEIAELRGIHLHTTAAVYFRIGEQLGLDWLRDRIGALPAAGFWERMARNALRDDTARLHRILAQVALEGAPTESDAEGIITSWMAAHEAPLAQYHRRLDELRGGSGDLAQLTVAADAIRRLLRGTEDG